MLVCDILLTALGSVLPKKNVMELSALQGNKDIILKSLTRNHSLSVILICKNEVDRIRECLASVVGLADQVVVLDSGSTDGTVEVIKEFDVQLSMTDWPGFGRQRQRALDLATGDWVLSIDADERVSPELASEINRLLAQPEIPCAVYRIPWHQHFLGKRMHFGRYASPQARLFRRQGAQYPFAQIHETLIFPDGEVGFLGSGLIHYSYRNYLHFTEKHDHYAWLLAKEKYARGERSGIAFAWLRSQWEFLHQYILRGLILDGVRGYLQARILAQYAFNKYASLWSLQETGASVEDEFRPELRLRRPD